MKKKRKSNSGALKRFRVTASGKVRFNHANHRHILTKKSRKQKRNSSGTYILSPVEEKRVKKILPYL